MLIFLRKCSESKGVIIAATTIIYLLGYTVWSINAYFNNLGFLPALDAQYFLSGLIPFFSVVFLLTFLDKIWIWIDSFSLRFHKKKKVSIAVQVFLLAILISAAFAPFVQIWYFNKSSNAKEMLFFLLLYCLILFSGILFQTMHNIERLNRKVPRTFTHRHSIRFGAIAVTFLFTIYYMLYLYPKVPQEFGGMRPKKASILFRNQMPQDSVSNFHAEKEYVVYYKNNEVVLVKPNEQEKITTEIKFTDILAITWK